MATSAPIIGAIGERLDLRIRQGATFGPHEITLTNPDGSPVDLTRSTLRGQIRRTALDAGLLAEFDCAISDAAAGKASFSLSATATAAMPAGEDARDVASSGVWDLELLDSAGRVTPVFYGAVSIFREVTRA